MTLTLVWTLLHFVWQGALIALLLAVLNRLLRRGPAEWRHGAACMALALMAAAPLATFRLLQERPAGWSAAEIALTTSSGGTLTVPTVFSATSMESAAPWITAVWLAGVGLLSIRWMAAWLLLQVKRRGVRDFLEPEWQASFKRLRARLGVARTVELRQADWLSSPSTIGWIRPVILVPAGALWGLSAAQLEAVLAHELAHIRRNDYLINLFQTAVETVLFYHPAVWWVSRRIREEREHCCDDTALAVCGDAHLYASALLKLAESAAPASDLAMAGSGGALKSRIYRVLYREAPKASMWPACAVLLAATVLFAWGSDRLLAQSGGVPVRYAKWLNEDVVYIIQGWERKALEALTTDAEREKFIVDFWVRRDPDPETPENRYKEEHYRRIAYSNVRFSAAATAGWKTDRGRMYIIAGPPDEIQSWPSHYYEIWIYRNFGGTGAEGSFRFELPR